MKTVREAQYLVAAHTRLLDTETVCSLDASGRVLAEHVCADAPIPDAATSTVDGYAVLADDGMAERYILDELTAGRTTTMCLAPGTAMRIMTGAPLPPGANAVVMVEHTHLEAGMLSLQQPVYRGEHIRTVGEDVMKGEQVATRGTVLGAAETGILAAIGRTHIQVARRPRVAVLSTGDEVVEPFVTPGSKGRVRDSNRYALLAAIREAGGEPLSLGIARDDHDELRGALLAGVALADVVITSGGVSMGTRDLVRPLLAELGTVHFERVQMQPGRPTTFATVRETPVFGLPGNPVSSLVAFELLVRPMLRRMQGDSQPERTHVQVTLASAMHPSATRPSYQRAIVIWGRSKLMAHSTGAQASSRLLSMCGANALVVVPPGDQPCEVGHELDALLTGPIVATRP